jgi:hypothetical protein
MGYRNTYKCLKRFNLTGTGFLDPGDVFTDPRVYETYTLAYMAMQRYLNGPIIRKYVVWLSADLVEEAGNHTLPQPRAKSEAEVELEKADKKRRQKLRNYDPVEDDKPFVKKARIMIEEVTTAAGFTEYEGNEVTGTLKKKRAQPCGGGYRYLPKHD